MNLRSERTPEVRQVEFRASDDADGNTLEGYAAVFNAWTDIRDSMGVYRERIAPGAFKRSLGIRTPVLQFDHGNGLIGSLPIGTPTVLREDKNGLFVRARLFDNWAVQPIRDAIAGGGISGMSFRFKVVKDDWTRDDDGAEARTIHDVELLELGPVVFPAYTQTSVLVRSLMDSVDDETRAELVREVNSAAERLDALLMRDWGTSGAAPELATDDGPDEPPIASRDNSQTIKTLLAESGLSFLKGTSNVSQ